LDTDPLFFVLLIKLNPINFEIVLGITLVIVLLIFSALISGSEVAYFSFNPKNIKTIRDNPSKTNKLILWHISNPLKLLATILIANNFVNIAIVILSTFLSEQLINFSSPHVKFFFEAVVITFMILLFGEIIPKVYSSYNNKPFASIMAYPLFVLEKIFKPLSMFLITSTSIINKQFQKKQNISIEDLSDAIDITSTAISQERNILEGIVKFGSIDVKEIMTPRIDVKAVDISTNFNQLKQIIIKNEYSRIPIYEETLDNIKGILFIKDLIKHLDNSEFNWCDLVRNPYFVPETKKIDDLLQEFQTQKNHMAIVSDEYGGISGIITLEDILEQIVGEINDEFDEEETTYNKIDENTYIFEGKTQINDFYRIIQLSEDIFDEAKGDADTLAGLILEIKGEFPKVGETIECKNYYFQIEAVDKRKINKIKVTIKNII